MYLCVYVVYTIHTYAIPYGEYIHSTVCMYVRSTVGRYSTRYASCIQSIDNYWTSFGHQSCLDESSGQNSIAFLHGIAFRTYLVFSKTFKTLHITRNKLLQKRTFSKRGMLLTFPTNRVFAASLKRRKWGSGIQIHIEITFILTNMQFIESRIN